MKEKLKTMIFSIALLGTTFVALGYFCERCHTEHNYISECASDPWHKYGPEEQNRRLNEIYKMYIYSIAKNEIKKYCRDGYGAQEVINKIRDILREQEWHSRYYNLFSDHNFTSEWTQERIDEGRKSLDEIERIIRDYHKTSGCSMDSPMDWEVVFGSGSKSVPDPSSNQNSLIEADECGPRDSERPFGPDPAHFERPFGGAFGY